MTTNATTIGTTANITIYRNLITRKEEKFTKLAKDQSAGTSVDVEKIKRQSQIVKEYRSFLKGKKSDTRAEITKLSSFQKKNCPHNKILANTLKNLAGRSHAEQHNNSKTLM